MPGLLQLIIFYALPFLFGAGFIYLGFGRAKKESAKLKEPTTWAYINQGAGYWILGLIFIGYGIANLFGLL